MMDKKSANGFQTKASDGGVQRKQLPYSVETPYGFHLDLDFLKYVDDIEKGNTIKRVHIQRRVKGPAKFSTLPRNFSLPGHGVRAPLREKDSTWSGTSTLGPKPRSRVMEVQQIFDFRASEGGIPSHSSRGLTSQGTGYTSTKSRDETGTGPQGVEDKTAAIQSRPNLLRASSMPISLQQRKGSDSSSPDCSVATPENGSTENVFRASPDVIERRCLPQDRAGLHQQITVALKRVRELEEQVKTIPELKAQICSLREEREKLLLQLQAHSQVQVSTSSSAVESTADTESRSHSQVTTQPATQPAGVSVSESVSVTTKERQDGTEITEVLPEKRETSMLQKQTLPSDKQKEPPESPLEHAAEKTSNDSEEQKLVLLKVIRKEKDISRSQDSYAAKEGHLEDQNGMQKLQEKLTTLETKLTQASQELEKTNGLLKEQIKENKAKEERILQLSEGMRVEICTTQMQEQPRRESIDKGTVTENIDFTNQNKETESPSTVDQGTDTETICIEVVVPTPRARSLDQATVTSKVDTQDQETEIDAEGTAVIPPRHRANSMERGTVTESIITQDQTTETPIAERVNQVTETEGETVTDHPHRPRASSVDRETETERVNTMDRVTETEVAHRTDQQTETETERQHSNNPAREAEADRQVRENESSQREDVGPAISDKKEDTITEEVLQRNDESIIVEVSADTSFTAVEGKSLDSAVVNQASVVSSPVTITGDDIIEVSAAQNDSEVNETQPSRSEKMVEPKKGFVETSEEKDKAKEEILCKPVKENVIIDSVVATEESSVAKTAAPVRPQRGRKPSAEQAQSPQAAPVRPRRGSSETQAQQTPTKTQTATQSETPSLVQRSESQEQHKTPSVPHVEDRSQVKKVPEEPLEKQSPAQPKADTQSPSTSSSEVQVRPKSIQAHSKSQTASRRDSKELKLQQKGSSVSHSRESGETKTRPTRQASSDAHAQPQSSRRSSSEAPSSQKDASETQSFRRGSSEATQRRGSSEATQRRGSSEAKASRRESSESQSARRGSSESPTSPAALGQVVTRITGLLGEQWAQLGSSSGAQQMATQQESPSTQKQTTTKKTEAGKGTSAKPAGKTVPAATTTKQAGKPGASKMSSIQSQLVSSLSVLSAFYSPAQKAAAANKQKEQGLKSIMKKNSVADKQGSKRAKKNLKFVGVNGGVLEKRDWKTESGYETTSSEESSGDEKSKVEVEEEDRIEPEMAIENDKESEETAEIQGAEAEALTEGGGAAGEEIEVERSLLDLEVDHELLVEHDEGEKVDKGFIDACIYVKDRMEEVSSPDKEMRQVLVVLYQEWFKVSSQKESEADTVRLYLRQVGMTTPTLLPYVVNLTDGNGNMALHYSVSHSNFPVVKLLLDTGLCETDNVNKAGYTPVMLAALTAAESPEDLEVAQQLLKLGDVNARSRQAGQTALMLAVSHGRVAMVKLLLSCGADVNAQDREGSTPLMCACEHGHTHIARLLLETGHCDTNLTDKNGLTALSVAEAAAHQDVVDLLKKHASEPTSAADPL